jgi:LysR family hydrogen peroxide-inducible transcriptional activator
MTISWLTLRDLQYLVAVAREGHFGRAAEACHVSQPTLSAQIKKIEDFLGVPLFERNQRRVSITDTGRRVADQAQVVLLEAEKILGLTQKASGPLEGTLRLGAIATLGPFLVPRFLSELRRSFPSLRLVLREGLTDGLLRELKEGTVDAVLAARTFDETGFHVMPLFFEPFVLAAPKGHPIAQKKPLRSADLRAEDMVLLEDGHCLRDQILETCPTNRRGHVRQFHATSVETLRALVGSGLGYTLLPKLAVRDRPLGELITYRGFDQASVGREIVLVCRSSYPAMGDVERLGRFLRAHRPPELSPLS